MSTNTPFCPLLNRYCLGSECVRFVPEVVSGTHVGLRVEGSNKKPALRLDGSNAPYFGTYTNRGVCSDNLRAEPFIDPWLNKDTTPAVEKAAKYVLGHLSDPEKWTYTRTADGFKLTHQDDNAQRIQYAGMVHPVHGMYWKPSDWPAGAWGALPSFVWLRDLEK